MVKEFPASAEDLVPTTGFTWWKGNQFTQVCPLTFTCAVACPHRCTNKTGVKNNSHQYNLYNLPPAKAFDQIIYRL